MTVREIVAKIRQLQAQERRLLRRGSRDELTEHRRNMQTWFSRLRQEIEAGPKRRILDLERELTFVTDPKERYRLRQELEQARQRQGDLNVDARMDELLQ